MPRAISFSSSAPRPRTSSQTIKQLVQKRLVGRFGITDPREIQVLTPMNRGPLGTQALNRELQDLLNPRGRELRAGDRRFREGDRVIQLRNNYDKLVFNGAIGRMVAIDPAKGQDRAWRSRRRTRSMILSDLDETRARVRDLDSQEPGQPVSRGRDADASQPLPDAAAQSSLHCNDPRRAGLRAGRDAERVAAGGSQRGRAPALQPPRRAASHRLMITPTRLDASVFRCRRRSPTSRSRRPRLRG